MRLRKPKRGDPIRADDIGALVDAVVHRIVGVQGVEVRRTRGSVTIGLQAGTAPGWRPGRIVEVVKPADPEQASALNVWYWVASVGRSDTEAVQIPVGRVFGRIDYTGNVRLVPAQVGDPCGIRDWIMPDGTNAPVMEVWTEAPAVDLACPPEGAGGNAAGGGFGGGFGGIVEVVLTPQAQGLAAEATSETEATGEAMSDWAVELEVEDFARAGAELVVAVPKGPHTQPMFATAQLVGLGSGGTPPLCEIVVGQSNTGANAVYLGAGALVLGGELGEAGRATMTGTIDVRGVGYLHFRLRTPAHGTALGSGTITVVFS